jgi:hypothetical protein
VHDEVLHLQDSGDIGAPADFKDWNDLLRSRAALAVHEVDGHGEKRLSCVLHPVDERIQRHHARATEGLHHDPDGLMHHRLRVGDGRRGSRRYRVSDTLK